MTILEQMGQKAREAARSLVNAGARKNAALEAAADALAANSACILEANEKDLAAARENGMSEALLDRLALSEGRVRSMADGVRGVAAQNDPIGQVVSGFTCSNGLRIERVRVPLGVIGIIYEARPNVTADAAALCLKAGSAVILRGGKEAIHSNTAIAEIMREAVARAGLPADAIQLVKDTARSSAMEMMNLTGYLDVLIPRGGAGLIRSVVQDSHVPVIETGVGNCHVYVDRTADQEMACEIVFNAKTTRPSVCNAMEKLLVHREIAEEFLPKVKARLDAKQVELRGDEEVRRILGGSVIPASDEDWDREYLDFILAVHVVDGLDEAVAHIARHGSGHSEAIVTNDYANANRFTSEVDAAAVYVNASTRFTDGGEFGLGAEIGISTQKLHARGPMGVNELTSTKFIISGNGQIR